MDEAPSVGNGSVPARRCGGGPDKVAPVLTLALSDFAATAGLVGVFFVLFPILAQGLIAFAIAQALGERAENQEYMARRSRQRSQG